MSVPLIILCAMSVPIAAIVSRAFVRTKELETQRVLHERTLGAGQNRETENAEIARLQAANDDLQQRIEVLETIVVGQDSLPAKPTPVPQLSSRKIETR